MAEQCCGGRRFLFVLSTGRSGSTTLLQALNALPGVRLRGEMLDLGTEGLASLQGLLALQLQVTAAASAGREAAKAALVHEEYDVEQLRCHLQQLLADLDPAARGGGGAGGEETIGFKEIMCHRLMSCGDWDGEQARRVEALVEQLLAIAPCAKVVFSLRDDVAAQAARQVGFQWTSQSLEQRAPFLAAVNRDVARVQRKLPRSTTIVTLESFGVRRFNELAAFVGFPHCRYTAFPHANAPSDDGEDGFKQLWSIVFPLCPHRSLTPKRGDPITETPCF
ncbi:hypothetical protein AB1Y20_018416 [Prymnesium parvum]|uniref:Protein-tyrosine sulfotransferase n=1 Tax=Prymnesium parvum TaxID=97485 RepID=A0AB34JRN9_PRYPA